MSCGSDGIVAERSCGSCGPVVEMMCGSGEPLAERYFGRSVPVAFLDMWLQGAAGQSVLPRTS